MFSVMLFESLNPQLETNGVNAMRSQYKIGRGVISRPVINVSPATKAPIKTVTKMTFQPDYRIATAQQAAAYRQSLIAKGIIKTA
jgi:hypothetical protein